VYIDVRITYMNFLKKIGDEYKAFNIPHTSVSENKLPDDVRLFQRIILTKDEKKSIPNRCHFSLGTHIHTAVQKIVCEKKTIKEVLDG